MSVVHIIEGSYYREGFFYRDYMGIFPVPRELSVTGRCSVRRGSSELVVPVTFRPDIVAFLTASGPKGVC